VFVTAARVVVRTAEPRVTVAVVEALVAAATTAGWSGALVA
jgi:hypothetical protein